VILVDGGGGHLPTADPSLDRDDFRDVGIRRGLVPGLMGVGFNNPAEALTWAYAAASYSLIRPPRIFVRVIRWAGNGMTFGSSSGASSFSPWP